MSLHDVTVSTLLRVLGNLKHVLAKGEAHAAARKVDPSALLNSRLALNRIDSRELVDISGKFDQLRGEFSSDYNTYESSFSALLKIDCKQKPAEFYAKLLSTRDARLKLADTVKQMNGNISDYRVAAEKVKAGLSGAGD